MVSNSTGGNGAVIVANSATAASVSRRLGMTRVIVVFTNVPTAATRLPGFDAHELERTLRDVQAARRRAAHRYKPPLHLLGAPPPRLPTSTPRASSSPAPWPIALRCYQGRRA